MENMSETLMMIPRSLFSLILLFLITKIIGKKQVSELSLFMLLEFQLVILLQK